MATVPTGFDLQGHRGARGARPENTWPAFRYALDAGVTTLEMDVVISKDSQVVVSHDPWMNPQICRLPSGEPVPTGAKKRYRLFEMTYDEIARFDCGGRRHPDVPEQTPRPAPKPLLRAVLRQAEGYAHTIGRPAPFYNIETKSRPSWEGDLHPAPEVFTRLLMEVIEEAGVTERATIQSFDPRTLQVARQEDFEGRLSLLIARSTKGSLSEHLERLGFTPAIYSPDHRLVDQALIEAAGERGMAVLPWTVNDPEAMRRLKDLGVDGLITDYPERGLFLLE